MHLPRPRGAVSERVIDALRHDRPLDRLLDAERGPTPDSADDHQLALWTLYELHYRGFDEVDDRREWDPDLISVRRRLEAIFETDLRSQVQPILARAADAQTVLTQVEAITTWPSEESLPSFLHREATAEQYREFLIQRSLYHLKESDPHGWALPRLDGAAKTALAELQNDEFGGGRPERLHSRLYAEALAAADLDPTYGAYVDQVSDYTLAVNNAMSLFGLHRRLRAAAMGHLAAFEMTSSVPCRRYLQGARRLELGAAVERYFDEHVEADAVHEHLALRGICVPLVDADPSLAPDVLLGAAVCVLLDGIAGDAMVTAWRGGRSTLAPTAERSAA